MAPGTGARVKALLSTLSPGPTPSARSAVVIAAPPEAVARQYRAPNHSANSCSSNAVSPGSPGVVL